MALNIKHIEVLANQYKKITRGVVDVRKYTWYSITHHSTSMEGSTLSESQVINLLEYGKTAAQKPYNHHLMVSDYFRAMTFAIKQNDNAKITPSFIKELSSYVMQNTGGLVNAMAGTYDISKGDFRKSTVRAGTRIFPDYNKVPGMVQYLCDYLNQKIPEVKTFEEKCNLAFEAHFRLVSIHPFGDGNGRVSRILMNYIQAKFNLPLSIVFKNDKIRYINALEAARKQDDLKPYFNFMYSQYSKHLKREIKRLTR